MRKIGFRNTVFVIWLFTSFKPFWYFRIFFEMIKRSEKDLFSIFDLFIFLQKFFRIAKWLDQFLKLENRAFAAYKKALKVRKNSFSHSDIQKTLSWLNGIFQALLAGSPLKSPPILSKRWLLMIWMASLRNQSVLPMRCLPWKPLPMICLPMTHRLKNAYFSKIDIVSNSCKNLITVRFYELLERNANKLRLQDF